MANNSDRKQRLNRRRNMAGKKAPTALGRLFSMLDPADNSELAKRDWKPKRRKDAVRHNKANSRKYRELVEAYIGTLKLNRKQRRKLAAILGQTPYLGPLLASDIEARDELWKQIICVVEAWQKQNPHLRFFFITLLADETRVRKKLPILMLGRLRRKADKTLRELDIDGALGFIQPAFILRPPDDHEPCFPFHSHAVAWAGEEFDLPEARAKLKKSRSWTNAWGVPPTDIFEITPQIGRASYFAGYGLRHMADCINVVERDDGTKSYSTEKGLRGDAVWRLIEGLSQCRLEHMVFGVKDGKDLRGPAWRATKAARKLAHPHLKPVVLGNLRKLFRSLWKVSRAQHDAPWRIFD